VYGPRSTVPCEAQVYVALKNGFGPRAGSWNLYGNNVDQGLITSIMDGMVKRTRLVDGKPTSLCDLVRSFHADSTSLRQERHAVRVQGYCDVGLDDNWQSCGDKRAAPGMNYHDGVYACAHVCVARVTRAECVRHSGAEMRSCVSAVQGNPIVNLAVFPSFKNMTNHAHKLGLTAGWYGACI
jgi:hypothetical protein